MISKELLFESSIFIFVVMLIWLKAFWSYRNILLQRWTKSQAKYDWSWLEEKSGGKLDENWSKRWGQYITMMDIIELWAKSFGAKTNAKSDELKYCLAAFIPLYDDYTDDFELKHKAIIDLLSAEGYKDNRQRIAAYLYNRIIEIHPNPSLFIDLLEKGGEAQDLSLQQKNPSTSKEVLWQITHEKGGYFTLLCFSIYFENFTKEQWSYIYDLGANIQLLNDTFDVYKDLQEQIKTLPNSAESMKEYHQFYSDRIGSWISGSIPFSIPKSKSNGLKMQFAIVFATGLICLEQYEMLENKYGVFNPSTLGRKELVCDMDSLLQVYNTFKKANSLINV